MNTKDLIKKYDIKASKRYGQNFLIDERVVGRIITGSGITADDTVLEIGPGTGNMTTELSKAAGKVIAIEVDESLKPVLTEVLSDCDNVTLVWGDVLKLDLPALLAEHSPDRNVKVVSNLPYYITTPIITYLLESRLPIDSITVMVQKEVAERMSAIPGTKEYGALTLAVAYHSTVEYVANVPPNAFIPRPNVDSVVVRLDLSGKPDVGVMDEQFMFRLIRAAFNQRRKTLVNAIKNSPELSLGREQMEQALEKLGFDVNVRGEVLSVREFAMLSDELSGPKPDGRIKKTIKKAKKYASEKIEKRIKKGHPALNQQHEPVNDR